MTEPVTVTPKYRIGQVVEAGEDGYFKIRSIEICVEDVAADGLPPEIRTTIFYKAIDDGGAYETYIKRVVSES